MITPTKHTDIRCSVLFLSSRILKYLRRENIIKFNDLIDMLVVDLGNKVKTNINITLTFLYALNQIQYVKELDAISLIEKIDYETN